MLEATPNGTYVRKAPPDVIPDLPRVSPLERRLNERIDQLARRLDEHERGHQ